MLSRTASLLISALACVILLSPARAEVQDLPIVFEDYPPYEYIEDGEVKGINMDLIREAFRRMGIKPFFEPRPWKRAMMELRTGDILALSSGFRTPEREEFIHFPAEGLAMEEVVVMALARRRLTMASLEDMRNMRIGLRTEYTYGKDFDSMTGLDKQQAATNRQLLQLLLAGRVDVIVANRAVISHLAKEIGRFRELDVIHEINREPLYLLFAKARGERARTLARKFGEAIAEMRRDGTFEAIRNKY